MAANFLLKAFLNPFGQKLFYIQVMMNYVKRMSVVDVQGSFNTAIMISWTELTFQTN